MTSGSLTLRYTGRQRDSWLTGAPDLNLVGRAEWPRCLMTDYDREYRGCELACCEPFAEFVEFFSSKPAGLSVPISAAARGATPSWRRDTVTHVHGIEIAASGVAQLKKRAEAEQQWGWPKPGMATGWIRTGGGRRPRRSKSCLPSWG